MRIAANQPYLFPYLGYFQLIAGVDRFVFLDSMQFVRRSWISRNRLLIAGRPGLISSPVVKDADRFLPINARLYTPNFLNPWIDCMNFNYKKAPFFLPVMELLFTDTGNAPRNIAEYNILSTNRICKYLEIDTPTCRLSEIPVEAIDKEVDNSYDKAIRREQKIINIVKHFDGTDYLNLPGGRALYYPKFFLSHGINLHFLQPSLPEYKQLRTNTFHPALSILDILMNCPVEQIKNWLTIR